MLKCAMHVLRFLTASSLLPQLAFLAFPLSFFFLFLDFFVDVYLVKNCGLHENNTEFYFVAISAIDYISKKQTNTYIHCVFTPIKR